MVNDLCKVVTQALTLIRDYRVKRNEMWLENDPDSLLSDELKAETAYETKLFANAEKAEYDHKLTDYKSGSGFPQVFDRRFRTTKTEVKELVAQLVLDKEAAEEGDLDTLSNEELEECRIRHDE